MEVIAGPPDPLLVGNVRLTMLKTLDLYNPEDLFRTPEIHELRDPVNLIEWLGVSTMGYPEPLTFGMRAKRYLKDKLNSFDIIHDNQCLSFGILSLMKQIPLTATIHHPMTVDRRIAVNTAEGFYGKLKQMRWYSFIGMQKYVARKLPRIITVSEWSKKDISREFFIPEERFTAIPIGINTDLFHPIETIKRETGRIIVTNSADTPLKGLSFLLQAISSISKKRPVRLIVIGSPQKNGPIEKLIKALDIREYIEFTGRIDNHQFVKEYARASMAVVPSLYEGFGLPAGEAMACRIPLICTSGGALPEVTGDAAVMVPPADALSLEKAILELMDDRKKQEKLAEAGFKRVMKHFTWQATAIKTVKAYREIIHDYR